MMAVMIGRMIGMMMMIARMERLARVSEDLTPHWGCDHSPHDPSLLSPAEAVATRVQQ